MVRYVLVVDEPMILTVAILVGVIFHPQWMEKCNALYAIFGLSPVTPFSPAMLTSGLALRVLWKM